MDIEGEKLKCETCKKSFTQSGVLKRHMKSVHEKLKPFQCDQCDRSFAGIMVLKYHKLRIHEKARDLGPKLSKLNLTK